MILQPPVFGPDRLDLPSSSGWIPDAFELGLFHFRLPSALDLSAAALFNKTFYTEATGHPGDDYRGFKTNSLSRSKLGYTDPLGDQVEFLQIELELWKTYFPPAVADVLLEMMKIAKFILKDIFRALKIDEEDLNTICGDLESNDLLQYCIFNHYRSGKSVTRGFTNHKDSGFLTILFSPEAGFETFHRGEWVPVAMREDCFLVVLGHTLEILTKKMPEPCSASFHRVIAAPAQLNSGCDRHSFGVYIGPRFDMSLFQYSETGVLSEFCSFLTFQKQKAAEMGYEFHPRIE